jgi:catechol 2,3-dioxygenase-like lactoylglutathione lyase family enzyme
VLGLKLVPRHGGRPRFDLGGVYLAIVRGKPRPARTAQPARYPVIAFAVDDLEAAALRLAAHGLAPPWGIEEDAGAHWVMFHDPAGNLIELAQFKDQARRAFES